MAHDVFISYSTKDKIIADAVCAKLEENKIRVWIAPRDVPAGSNFGASIIKAINSCKVFVLIWSAHTNTSEHIMNEVNQAFDRGITIIPFRIQDIQPTDEMRYYFGRTHWLDAINPPLENHIAVLRNTILTNLGREIPVNTPIVQPDNTPETNTLGKEQANTKVEVESTPVMPEPQKKRQNENKQLKTEKTALRKIPGYFPYAAGGLVIFALFTLWITGVFRSAPLAETTQTLPSLTKTIAPGKTTLPTPTSTPVPAWIAEANTLADPILSAKSYQLPDFEDDFSNVDPGWIAYADPLFCSNVEEGLVNIVQGTSQYGVGPNCRLRHVKHPELKYKDFFMQVDIDLKHAGSLNWSFQARQKTPSQLEPNQSFDFYMNGYGGWWTEITDPTTEGIDVVTRGNAELDDQKPVTITIIHKDKTYLYYLNSKLVTSYTNTAEYDSPIEFIFGAEDFSDGLAGIEMITLDNVKVWDLDKLIIPETILTAIENQTPNFTDDFSNTVNQSWNYHLQEHQTSKCPVPDDAEMTFVEGAMRLRIGPGCWDHTLSLSNERFSTNYVLQMDIDFQQAPHVSFGVEPGHSTLALDIHGSGSRGIGGFPKYDGRFDPTQPLQITMIINDDTQWVYLGSTLIATQSNLPAFSDPLTLYFHIYNTEDYELSDFESVALDNIRIWELNDLLKP